MSGLVLELAAAHHGAGGKARGLALLIGDGVDVPPGFALAGDAFRAVIAGPSTRRGPSTSSGAAGSGPTGGPPALSTVDETVHLLETWARAAEEAEIPGELEAEVLARARALGGELIVRSSMAFEDGEHGAAPGLGRSIARVPPDEVWRAIRAVWAASMTPLVAVYARAAGGSGLALAPPGVIVQRWIAGASCTVYTRPPGRPDADEVWIDRAGAPPIRAPRHDEQDPRIALARAAERAIGASRGADVELVGAEARWIVVQARPLVHPSARPARTPAPPFVVASLAASGRVWRRDVTHNPQPMSTAQAGLCERVEHAGIAPFHLGVAAGYLYSAPREGVVAPTAPTTAEEMETAYALAAAEVDQILAAAYDAPLADVLQAYVAAYRVLTAELAPLIAAARAATEDLAAYVTRRPSSIAAMMARAARGELSREALLEIVGDSAPAWDVASPTFAEQPALLEQALTRAAARPAAPEEPAAPEALRARVALARAAADVAERDDLLFARAQAMVRRALLAVAGRTGLGRDDVFWLPLDELAAEQLPPLEVAMGHARAARAAAARATAWDMPLVVGAAGRDDGAAGAGDVDGSAPRRTWQGSGLGGKAVGPVARFAGLGDAALVKRGEIVVAAAVTPAMALLVEGAAAIVCEHGSLLDHGAAMARELGIPCVVGCEGVVDAVADGEWLEIDGDAGQVRRA